MKEHRYILHCLVCKRVFYRKSKDGRHCKEAMQNIGFIEEQAVDNPSEVE